MMFRDLSDVDTEVIAEFVDYPWWWDGNVAEPGRFITDRTVSLDTSVCGGVAMGALALAQQEREVVTQAQGERVWDAAWLNTVSLAIEPVAVIDTCTLVLQSIRRAGNAGPAFVVPVDTARYSWLVAHDFTCPCIRPDASYVYPICWHRFGKRAAVLAPRVPGELRNTVWEAHCLWHPDDIQGGCHPLAGLSSGQKYSAGNT